MWSTDPIFLPNIFDPQLVEFVTAQPLGMEGWVYLELFIEQIINSEVWSMLLSLLGGKNSEPFILSIVQGDKDIDILHKGILTWNLPAFTKPLSWANLKTQNSCLFEVEACFFTPLWSRQKTIFLVLARPEPILLRSWGVSVRGTSNLPSVS